MEFPLGTFRLLILVPAAFYNSNFFGANFTFIGQHSYLFLLPVSIIHKYTSPFAFPVAVTVTTPF